MNSTNDNSSVASGSMINVWMDETTQQIVQILKAEMLQAYQNMGPALEKKGTWPGLTGQSDITSGNSKHLLWVKHKFATWNTTLTFVSGLFQNLFSKNSRWIASQFETHACTLPGTRKVSRFYLLWAKHRN